MSLHGMSAVACGASTVGIGGGLAIRRRMRRATLYPTGSDARTTKASAQRSQRLRPRFGALMFSPSWTKDRTCFAREPLSPKERWYHRALPMMNLISRAFRRAGGDQLIAQLNVSLPLTRSVSASVAVPGGHAHARS